MKNRKKFISVPLLFIYLGCQTSAYYSKKLRCFEFQFSRIVKTTISIISEAIFGFNAQMRPIEPRQTFTAYYAQLPLITDEVYQQYKTDVKQLDRQLQREELLYYSTALLWLRLIDEKAKQVDEALTSEEKALRKVSMDVELNVPQPIYAYLSQIGDITDRMGKRTKLTIPALPIVRAGNFGGYHANEITANTHNLFEEVPSLGIAGDVVMALTSADELVTPNFRVARPDGSEFTDNLSGNSLIGPRQQEIRQRLAGLGIQQNAFPEFVTNTRFNWRYIQQISDILQNFETFRIEKVCFSRLTCQGGPTMAIKTRPIDQGDAETNWRDKEVQPVSSSEESTACLI